VEIRLHSESFRQAAVVAVLTDLQAMLVQLVDLAAAVLLMGLVVLQALVVRGMLEQTEIGLIIYLVAVEEVQVHLDLVKMVVADFNG
jgi:hypothetical protein